MISVVIATHNDERTLGQTLASFVPAAVDALVREVLVADADSTDRTVDIAEDACADWLLILEVSAPAPHGWEGAAGHHIERHPGKAACWGKSGLAPFATPAKALLVPRKLLDKEAATPGWLRRLGGKATTLKIRR